MTRKILVADLLCGAGGSSTGAQRALAELDLEMELVCVNHWPVAIDTHSRNHPEARHYVQDIATVRPHLLVPEGYLDLLMASPTCTHHSVARGGKPTSDQQRSDPWHIITWLTELRVKRLIIENVWEFIGWGPVDPVTQKPIASRKGEYFLAWIETIKRLGFEPEWRKLNAADYGDATTRQRFILMARSDGRRVHWPMPTHRKRDAIAGDLFSGAKPWRPARDIIDWSIKGRSIINRPKPLAPKTLVRIYAGALKFGWPRPFILLLLREIERSLLFHIRWTLSVRNASEKVAKRRKRRALVLDLIERLRHFRLAPEEFARGGRSTDPMLITLRRNAAGSSVERPVPTIAANGLHIGLAEPVLRRRFQHEQDMALGVALALGPNGVDTLVGEALPLPQLSPSDAAARRGLSPVSVMAGAPLVLSQHTSGGARSTDEPLPTITTGGAGNVEHPGCARPMLVEPFVLSQASGGAPRLVGEPLPTIVTGGQRGSGTALISPYYGSGSGETCVSTDDPLPTVTAKGRFGMVVPVTQSGGGATARDIADPIPTLTTAKGGEFAFVVAQFGEREGQSPRVHDLDEPAPTICATGRVNLVEGTDQYDILFRMLEPPELAGAMGLAGYRFAGTKTEQIKQIGNAVSVAKMKACVGAIMADEAPDRERAGVIVWEAAE